MENIVWIYKIAFLQVGLIPTILIKEYLFKALHICRAFFSFYPYSNF